MLIAVLKSWNRYSHTLSLLCGLHDLIKIEIIPGQLLHLLCLSEIGNPELALLVCDLNIGWYSWAIVLVRMILGSCIYFCWWMVLMSLLILLNGTLSHPFFTGSFSHHDKQIQKQYQNNCWSLDQQCLCLDVHAASYHIILIMILIISADVELVHASAWAFFTLLIKQFCCFPAWLLLLLWQKHFQ